jgi:hypothetical protein
MSNTATALLIGGSVIAVGGVVAFFAMRRKQRADAPVVSMPGGAGTPEVAGPAKSLSTGEALAVIGGKALQEGVKYAVLGASSYALSLAGRAQKQG